MKLRCHPSDFCVDERNSLSVGRSGSFAVYRLKKSGWTTLDVLQKLARDLKINRRRIHHAGLKDRHAETSQVITIEHGPQRDFDFESFAISYQGQAQRAVTAHDIEGNVFSLVMRSVTENERLQAEKSLPVVQATGLTNYFDDQRFGSFIPGHSFIAEHWIRREYERALWLMFAEPRAEDGRDERQQREILRTHWNQWSQCKQELERSHRRSIVTFLDDRPGDFKGAWERVNADLRGLCLSAFQSYLWNAIVDGLIRERLPDESRREIQIVTGALACPDLVEKQMMGDLSELEIPLPSARLLKQTINDPNVLEMVQTGVEKLGWQLEAIKVQTPRDRFFSRGLRALTVPVNDLTWSFSDDDLFENRDKLELKFTLPKGSYATMLIKQIMPSVDPD
ncbi:tRNA pseudouridine synthase D [Thalassoglobus neptunius]|uniref:tRNA pseudouridine synthase D n=2 Tax=Thalassoglobus neptunius TaxID=1938619 RepID=A0A5C5W663_9PLAN|nr:tRNA pseudouridine synthase D [Thalassoglobus neptunius]